MHFEAGELAGLGALFAAVCAAVGGLLVKFWPVLTQSKMHREAAAAKLRQDAHEQVAEEYRDMIDRQQKQLDNQAVKIDAMHDDMRKLQQAHAECLVSNQALQGRLGVVEATLERVTTTQAVADIPTRSEAVIVADQEGTITEWNQAATVLFHWRSDEALGMDLRRLIPARYLPLHEARWQEVLRTGRPVRRGPFVLEAQTKDGAKLAVEMILSGWIEPNDGSPTAFFSASIRKLPVDARGRVLERGGYRPLPIPEPSPTAAVNVAPPPAMPPPDSDAHDPTEPHP